MYDVPYNVYELVSTVEGMTQDVSVTVSSIAEALQNLTNLGVFDYKDGIPINSVVFAGSTHMSWGIHKTQSWIDTLASNGNTVTFVIVNSSLALTNTTAFRNVTIVQWSEDSTELLTNIRKNMKCGGGSPVYRPCKKWFSFVPDIWNTLSATDFETQRAFLRNEYFTINRPDKIQMINTYTLEVRRDWNSPDSHYLPFWFTQITGITFNLNKTLNVLYDNYYQKHTNKTRFPPPFVAWVPISNTSTYENYGGADEVVQKLKDAGFQLTFFLMGPDVDETKLTNYTTNFVYWRNMSNPEPENWEQVRLKAYGCDQTTEF
ncbi:hypothetical protein FO519_009521 [Halicephalobus sp. NKZ332]|nr:hypothetical protein FO519_009521 [Halicephalobus sp. NKZ332]